MTVSLSRRRERREAGRVTRRAGAQRRTALPARAWRAEASRGMQSRGRQETHKLPQKTNPAPPRTPPSPIASGQIVRSEKWGRCPRPLMPSRASARRPIYLYWLFSLTRRYHVARLTPADSHGARSCSSGVPARRTTPTTNARPAGSRATSIPWCARSAHSSWLPRGHPRRSATPCTQTTGASDSAVASVRPWCRRWCCICRASA